VSKDLFFIAMFVKAFQSAQPDEALEKAFDQIEHLGKQPSYRQSFLQFEAFLRDVYFRLELWRDENIRELIVELATGIIGDNQSKRQAALEIIQRCPGWQSHYRALCEMLESGSVDNGLSVLEIYHGQRRIEQIPLTGLATSHTIADIEPGRYLIRLGTGLVIWDGRLSAQELIWTEAFGQEGLAVAAETGDVPQKPTGQYILLDGEVILRTFAGIEKGSVEVELTRGEG